MEADSPAGVAPGARLSEARQALGLATADVARRLKLSVGQVEALEAGRFDELPGHVFVRGFVRNYAKLVKLDPDELVQAAGDSLPQAAARPEVPPSQDIPFPTATGRRWPQFAIAAAVVVGLLAVYEFAVNEAPQTVATRPAEEAPPARSAPAKRAPNVPSPPPAARSGAPEVTAPIARHSVPAAPSAPAAP